MGPVRPSRIVESRRPFYGVARTSCRRRWGRWNRWIAAIQRSLRDVRPIDVPGRRRLDVNESIFLTNRHSQAVCRGTIFVAVRMVVRIGEKEVCNSINSVKICVVFLLSPFCLCRSERKKHLHGIFRLFCLLLTPRFAHVRLSHILDSNVPQFGLIFDVRYSIFDRRYTKATLQLHASLHIFLKRIWHKLCTISIKLRVYFQIQRDISAISDTKYRRGLL